MPSTELSSERCWDFLTKHCKWVHSFSVTGCFQCVKINGSIKGISRADSGVYLFTLIGTGTQDILQICHWRQDMLLGLSSARRLSELTTLSVDPCCCYPRVTAAGGLSDPFFFVLTNLRLRLIKGQSYSVWCILFSISMRERQKTESSSLCISILCGTRDLHQMHWALVCLLQERHGCKGVV